MDIRVPLYHKARTGAIHSWRVYVEGDTIYSEHGQVDGQKIISTKTATGKNIGRSNETSPEQQAVIESQAMWTFKRDRKYSLSPDEAKEDVLLPMLAQPFEKRESKLTYPLDVQPKLDGCFPSNASVVTNKGHLPIGRIVNERIECEALSWNEVESKFEFKPVINYFNNGAAPQTDWCEIRLDNRRRIKTTWSHKFLTNDGWIAAKDLDVEKHTIASNTADSRIMGLLLGTLLGDASLTFDKRAKEGAPRLTFGHKCEELVNHKVEVLGIPGRISDELSGYGTVIKKFCSSNNFDADLGQFYYLDSQSPLWGKRKPVTQKLLRNYLSKEGLSLWIADDGSLRFNNGNKDTPILSLSTHSQTDNELEEIVAYFKSVWGVSPTVVRDKRVGTASGSFLAFKAADTVYLLSRLRDVVWKGAEYKFFFAPEGYVQPTTNSVTYQGFTIQSSRKCSPITKYDIEVADNHNYVVNGVVAHNCRALARWEGDKVVLISRSGKPWLVTTHINGQLERIMPKGTVLDGEIYLHGKGFQWITARTKKRQPGTELLEYHVYDMPETNGDDSLTWQEREFALFNFFAGVPDDYHIKSVKTLKAVDKLDIMTAHDSWVAEGYEGLIARVPSAPYEYGHRSPNLLKVKSFSDSEYPIVGHTDGLGVEKGLVIWTCSDPKSGKTFDTRPRGTHDERRQLFNEAESHYGQQLSVRFFGLTDEGLPRFPIGNGIRAEEDMS